MVQGRVLVVVLLAVSLVGVESAAALPLPAIGSGLMAEQPCDADGDQSASLCYEAPAIEVLARRARPLVLGWTAPTVEIRARRTSNAILTWAARPIEIEGRRPKAVLLSWAAPTIEVRATSAMPEPQAAETSADMELERDLGKAAAAVLHLADESLAHAAAAVAATVERLEVSLADQI